MAKNIAGTPSSATTGLAKKQAEVNAEGILSSIRRKSLSAIGGFFNGIDTFSGASSIRDVLALRNPLDQFLTPFSDENKASGREVLRNFGLAGRNKKTGIAWDDPSELAQDTAGFALDIALDPTSWIAPGVTKAGNIASKAGIGAQKMRYVAARAGAGLGKRASRASTTIRRVLAEFPDEAADLTRKLETAAGSSDELKKLMDEPLGGTIGWAMPFERNARRVFNNDKVNSVLDTIGDYTRQAPGVKQAFQMIGGRRRGAESEVGQKFAEDISDAATDARGVSTQIAFDMIDKTTKAEYFKNYGTQRAAEADFWRFVEGVKEVPEHMKDVVKDYKKHLADNQLANEKLGLNVARFKDDAIGNNYAPRTKVTPADRVKVGDDMSKVRKTTANDPHGIERNALYRGIKGGTGDLVEATDDGIKMAKNLDPKQAVEAFDRKYGPKIPGGLAPLKRAISAAKAAITKGADNDGVHEAVEKAILGRGAGDWMTEVIAEAIQDGRQLREGDLLQEYATELASRLKSGATPKDAIEGTFGNQRIKKFAELWKESFDNLKKAEDDAMAAATKAGQKFKRVPLKQLSEAARVNAQQATAMAEGTTKSVANRLLKSFKKTGKIDSVLSPDESFLKQMVSSMGSAIKGIDNTAADFEDQVRAAVMKQIEPVLPDDFTLRTKTGDVVKAGRRKQIISRLYKPAREGDLENGLFADPFTAFQRRLQSGMQAQSVARNVIKTMSSRPILKRAEAQGAGEVVSLGETLKALKFNTDPNSTLSVMAAIAEEMGLPPRTNLGMIPRLIESGMLPPTAVDEAGELTAEGISALNNVVSRSAIPKVLHDDLVKIAKKFDGPDPVGKIGEALRWATNLEKAAFTSPWPSFHVRNRMSGALRNILRGMWNKKDTANAKAAMQGKTVKGALKRYPIVADMVKHRGMDQTDESATLVIRELLHSFDMSGEGQGQWIGKELGTVLDFGEAMEKIHSPSTPTPVKDFMRGWAFRDGASLKPWKEEFGPYVGGASLGQYIEGMNRGEAFLNLISKGVDPAQASRMVKESQVDYAWSAYTQWERQIFQTLYPFWKFQSRNIASTLKEVAQHPGGATAIGGKAIAAGHDPDDVTPEHIATSAAIPIGVNPDGSKRYLTGLGTMEEAAFQYLNPDLQGTLRAGISNMNPLFKWIPELAAGETFFQAGEDGSGRDLTDLDPLMGRIGANVTGRKYPYRLGTLPEYIAGSSPASRVLHTLRTLTDPRKGYVARGVNTLTGFRVSDVSEENQAAVIQDAVEQLMKESGGRAFSGMYFPQDMELDPTQLALKQLLKELNEKSRARREARKAKEK